METTVVEEQECHKAEARLRELHLTELQHTEALRVEETTRQQRNQALLNETKTLLQSEMKEELLAERSLLHSEFQQALEDGIKASTPPWESSHGIAGSMTVNSV